MCSASTPLRGRGFRPADDGVGGNNHVVLLTEEFWRSHFGADETVLGRTITIDDVACEVVGIVPAGSWFFRDPKFFVPAVLDPANNDRASRFSHWADVYGRMKAGVSVAQLDAELKAIKRRLAPEYPDYKQDWNVRVLPLGPTLAENPRPVLFILAGAVALVLLIVAANVANLLLARASRRRREIALRAALGATGRRLVRQTLTESLLLAFLGGAGGAFLSWWGVRAIGRLSADLVPAAMAPQLDVRVLLVSLLLTCGTGVLFGVLPALQARRLALNDALKVGGHGGSAGRPRSQSALVVAELALSVVLLAGAGLLLRSLARVATFDAGINPGHVLTFDLSPSDARYPTRESRVAYIQEAVARVRAVPGVASVGSTIETPFRGGSYGEFFSRVDRPETRFDHLGRVNFIAGDYFEAMGMRLVRGRALQESEGFQPEAPRVIVVNQTVVDTFFPDEDPIGASLVVAGAVGTAEIVGVVADARSVRLDRPPGPIAYAPEAFALDQICLVVRTSGLAPEALIPPVRAALSQLDPTVPLANVRSLDEALRDSLAQRRLVFALIGGFAIAGLVLACVGLYGVMSYAVETRRRELSIRVALGAARGDVVGVVVRDGVRLIVIGLVVGLVATAAVTKLLASQLFGVTAHDPLVIGGAMLLLGAVALSACGLPAWRAARADPLETLRSE